MCREVSSFPPPAVRPSSVFWPASSSLRAASSDWIPDVDAVFEAIHHIDGGIWVRPMPSVSRSEASHVGA